MQHLAHADNSRYRWVFWGFVGIAGFFLLAEHRAHLLGILPYLLLAACPLMHLFMHHGHGHRHGPRADEEDRP
ncbi:MAG: DUF2933 domain-containing protein [Pseudomonas sp.]|uniref:DUF2933 domain-containing protein n=1 Tax=Pseudomonas sp. TaxID=306 RepID=UPI0027334F40|nr:DUF2933 domain-containing protein [Pseudomonas sp.]MDP3845573.1 DUF2933 domain-containing protein [Pseudomonas sp.]